MNLDIWNLGMGVILLGFAGFFERFRNHVLSRTNGNRSDLGMNVRPAPLTSVLACLNSLVPLLVG